eukprot:3111566-Alexandrium_andersonii.AAC.1
MAARGPPCRRGACDGASPGRRRPGAPHHGGQLVPASLRAKIGTLKVLRAFPGERARAGWWGSVPTALQG